jgi:hypothetical protein
MKHRNAMIDNNLSVLCLVDGKTTPFIVEVGRTKTVDQLKKLIKAEKANEFSDFDADMLTLWCVSIPDADDEEDEDLPILLNNISSDDKKKLKATHNLSDVFQETPPKKTMHIIVQATTAR